MGNVKISELRVDVENVVNLNAVTSAEDGSAVDVKRYKHKTVFVTVTGNTGAVTVNIEVSHDGTNWFNRASKTYTATNSTDVFGYEYYYPYMRTTTTTQSNSTVSTVIVGRS